MAADGEVSRICANRCQDSGYAQDCYNSCVLNLDLGLQLDQSFSSSCKFGCSGYTGTQFVGCYNGCMKTSRESYRPYSPFYSNSLSSKPNRVMWIIILIFIVGLVLYMSQQK